MATEPPIVEVVITLQFEPLVGLTAVDIAELFQRYGDAYRTVQHVPSLMPLTLDDTGPAFQFEPASAELPRTWFVSEDLRYVLQFQADRFSVNWRRLGPEQSLEYPRYAAVLERFRNHFAVFAAWADERFSAAPKLTIGELAFVNAVPMMTDEGHIRLSRIFTFIAPSNQRRIRNFLARWTEVLDEGVINVTAGIGGMPDGRPAATLQLAARRTFDGDDLETALIGLDQMRPHLHSAFESAISREFWGRDPE